MPFIPAPFTFPVHAHVSGGRLAFSDALVLLKYVRLEGLDDLIRRERQRLPGAGAAAKAASVQGAPAFSRGGEIPIAAATLTDGTEIDPRWWRLKDVGPLGPTLDTNERPQPRVAQLSFRGQEFSKAVGELSFSEDSTCKSDPKTLALYEAFLTQGRVALAAHLHAEVTEPLVLQLALNYMPT